jgi:hypothetical protein
MTRKTKTFRVDVFKDHVNSMLRDSKNELVEGRKVMASMLETVLMASGNYHGFRMLEEKDVKPGHTFGIVFDDVNHNHTYPDDSRVSYY